MLKLWLDYRKILNVGEFLFKSINCVVVDYFFFLSLRRMYDAIIHVGNFAHDMNTEDALVGGQFMKIETLAAYAPYMVCAGNHEEK